MGGEYSVTDSLVEGREGDIPIRDYLPDRPGARTPLLWVHGGGFVLGGLDMKEPDAPARHLAAQGRWVRTIDYRLAPNLGLFSEPKLGAAPGRFPDAHNDVLDVAEAMRADAGPIHIGGASAGANLVAGAVLALRDRGAPLPRAVALVYGAFHSVLPDDVTVENALRGPIARWFFNPVMTRRMYLNYVGDDSQFSNSYAFPAEAELTGFPPTLSVDASNDRIRSSGTAFHLQLTTAGVPAEHLVVTAKHGFLGTPRHRAFATGMSAMGEWLQKHDTT